MKVGFTGTRQGMSSVQAIVLEQQLIRLDATELHHGDCQGSDLQAHSIARLMGLWIVSHPPKATGLRAFTVADETRTVKQYLARNHDIVLETTVLIACPGPVSGFRSGTWATVRFASRLQLPVLVIAPDGSFQEK